MHSYRFWGFVICADVTEVVASYIMWVKIAVLSDTPVIRQAVQNCKGP